VRKFFLPVACIFLFSGCTTTGYNPKTGEYYWRSTKKVILEAEGEKNGNYKFKISTDPDSQYIMIQKMIELAGGIK